MNKKPTTLALSMALCAVVLAPFATAHLTATNLNANPATLDGTGDPCRNQALVAGACEISLAVSGTYTAAGNFITSDAFPIWTPRPSTLPGPIGGPGGVFPTDPIGPVQSLDPRVGLCVGFADSNPRSGGSDGAYCVLDPSDLCDSEWITTGNERETIVEADFDSSGADPGSVGILPDGMFDDGGEGNTVCHIDNGPPEWNTPGCSSNLNAKDAATDEIWLGSFCDSVTVISGGPPFDDCFVNQAILGAYGLMGVVGAGADGLPGSALTMAETTEYCLNGALSQLLSDPLAPVVVCAATGVRDGADTARFGAGSTPGGVGLPPALAPTTGTCTNPDQLLQHAQVYNLVDAGSDNGGPSIFIGGSHGWVDGQ